MGKKVLIVEDEPLILHILVRRVEAAGYEVQSTSREEEAVALATQQEFDVVLADLQLGKWGSGTGISVIYRIKLLGKTPRFALMSVDPLAAKEAGKLGVPFIEKEKGFVQKVLDFIAE